MVEFRDEIRAVVFTLVAAGLTGCAVVEEVARQLPAVLAASEEPSAVGSSEGVGDGAAAIVIADTRVRAGGAAALTAKLRTGGHRVAGAQNDIRFVDGVRVSARGGRPDCEVNPSINKTASAFAFLPSGCSGASCSGVRAIILSLTDLRAIPDGAELYTCTLSAAESAVAGEHLLAISGVALSSPSGDDIDAGSTGGRVQVLR